MADQLFPQFDDGYEDDDELEVESTDSDDEEQDAAEIEDDDVLMDVRTPLFDFDAGDFVLNKSGKMRTASPDEAWSQWCVKNVATPRYHLLSYGQNYGVDEESAMIEMDTESKLNALESEITDALLADPNNRTADVGEFVWSRSSADPSAFVGYVDVENADQTTIGLTVVETDSEVVGGE